MVLMDYFRYSIYFNYICGIRPIRYRATQWGLGATPRPWATTCLHWQVARGQPAAMGAAMAGGQDHHRIGRVSFHGCLSPPRLIK